MFLCPTGAMYCCSSPLVIVPRAALDSRWTTSASLRYLTKWKERSEECSRKWLRRVHCCVKRAGGRAHSP